MRVHSVDAYRGLVVLLMIVYHYFAIQFFTKEIDVWIYTTSVGVWFGHFVRVSFLMLVGLSTKLLIDRGRDFEKHQFERFLKVACAAGLVSVCTYIVIPGAFIAWGVLHLIAFSILCLCFANKLNKWIWIFLSVLVIGLGLMITGQVDTSSSLFLPFGFYPVGFKTVDYFPIFPWAGVVFLGYGLSDYLLDIFKLFKFRFVALEWIGKKALWIYLIHVPLLYLLIAYLL